MSKLLITDTICQKAFPEDVGKLMAEKTTSMAERLHLARIRIGLHMVGLAKATGFARSTLIALEAGKSFPHPKTIRRLAEVLGVDETWLVFGDPAPGHGAGVFDAQPPGDRDQIGGAAQGRRDGRGERAGVTQGRAGVCRAVGGASA